MSFPETDGVLRHVEPPVSVETFARTVEDDGPAAPAASTSAAKVRRLPRPAPRHVVWAQLRGGARVELSSYGERAFAVRAAKVAMHAVRVADRDGDWPLLGGCYVRPDAVLAIEVTSP